MSLQGEQLSAPALIDGDIEQLLLGLADGSYVLSTPDGVVAECGIGAGALLGANPEDLAGHPAADVLASACDPAQRAAFEQLLHGDVHGSEQRFAATCADGCTVALTCLVVTVPLALGWEFTALLSELGSRDADSWKLDELRVRHERALEAVESVCETGAQPDTGGRLAGILVVIADSQAPPLTREGVGDRMQQHREAVREAREAARRAELGLDDPDGDTDAPTGGLEDLVERAQLLRARVEEAEFEAAGAYEERDRLRARLDVLQGERDANADQLVAEHEQALAQLQDAHAERQRALDRLAVEQAERERAIAALQAEQAERQRALARLAQVEAERDQEAQRRAGAESHAATTHDARLQELAGERDAARGETQAARAAAGEARAAADTARVDSERLTAELQALRDSIRTHQATSVSADAELQALRAEVQAGHAATQAARDALRVAQADAETAHGDQALARGEIAAMRGELDSVRGALDAARRELAEARDVPTASPEELQAARAEVDERVGEIAHAREELQRARAQIDAGGQELQQAQAQIDADSQELAGAREEITSARGELEAVRGELEASRGAADELRAERDQALAKAAELQEEADRARTAAEAIRAEFAFEPPASAAPGSRPLRNPFAPRAKPIMARSTSSEQQAHAAPAPDLPSAQPGVAIALIGSDGTFRRLDDAFCSLLGCQEDELRNARWPSIIDRDNLKDHQEIARALRAGEMSSAAIETIYMHKRGLLVPVEGTVSMHRDAGGESYILFRADVRRTSGAPA